VGLPSASRRRLRVAVGLGIAIGAVTFVAPGIGAAESVTSENVSAAADRESIREAAGRLQAKLKASHDAAFGGIWIADDGSPVIAVVGDGVAIRAAARGALPVEPDFRSVLWTESQLEELHERVRIDSGPDARLGSAKVSTIATDLISNRVVVTLLNGSSTELREVEDRYGPAVAAVSSNVPIVGSCSNANCPNPLKAGLKLYQNSTFWCMGGFIFQATGPTYYGSTAGHCSSIGNTYQHPAGTNRGSDSHQGWVNNSVADVSLFPIAAAQKSNKLCRGSTTCTVISMTSREDTSQEIVGQALCNQRQSGDQCLGTLQNKNVSVQVCQGSSPCYWMLQQRQSSMFALPGDSGGPVWYINRAIGMVSSTPKDKTTPVYYSHIRSIEWQFSVQTQLAP